MSVAQLEVHTLNLKTRAVFNLASPFRGKMEDPASATLTPRRLVMTTSACFYCGAVQAKWVEIEYLFGLNACAAHTAAAERDCRAYLHEKKMVKFSDAYKHPILGQFLKMLKGVSFPVLRSSGELQAGWMLNTNPLDRSSFFMHNELDGEWMVPVRREGAAGEEALTKCTPIFNLKMANLFSTTLIDETVFCLVDGVYTLEYEEVCRLRSSASALEVPEIPGVVHIIYEGQVGRMMIPGAVAGAAAAAAVAAAAASVPDTTENPS